MSNFPANIFIIQYWAMISGQIMSAICSEIGMDVNLQLAVDNLIDLYSPRRNVIVVI